MRGPAAAENEVLLKRLIGLALATAAVAGPMAASAQAPNINRQSIAELEAGIENEAPVTYLALASRHWEQGAKDEAVFWFYLGQIRYRYYLQANPDLEPGGAPALFGSMMAGMAGPINEYALCDIPQFRRSVDRALAWDASHPNGFTPKDKAPAVLESVRSGLVSFRDRISAQEQSLRAQCAAKARETPAGG
jgi:hypothetical protein